MTTYLRINFNERRTRMSRRRIRRERKAPTSIHYQSERTERDRVIEDIIGLGTVVAKFEVDKGHKNGSEIHSVTNTGIIIVNNKRTNKMVTRLIARPGQIERYWNDRGTNTPEYLMKLAFEHQELGYNLV